MDDEIWAVMQRRVCHRQINSVDELKWRLIDAWCSLKQSTFDEAADQWRGRLSASVRVKEQHFDIAFQLTMLILSLSVTFSVI